MRGRWGSKPQTARAVGKRRWHALHTAHLLKTAGSWCHRLESHSRKSADACIPGGAEPPRCAGQAPVVQALANWTLQQPLAARPGERYSYTNDAFWLLSYIIEKMKMLCKVGARLASEGAVGR